MNHERQSPRVLINYQPEEVGRKGVITVCVPGLPLYTDRLDPTSSKDRDRVVQRLTKTFPGIDPVELEHEILEIGSVVVSKKEHPSERPPTSERFSQARQLLTLVRGRYRVGRTDAGEPFLVPKDGSGIAQMLRSSTRRLHAEIAFAFTKTSGKAPSSSGIAEALLVLEGEALRAKPEKVHLRVAKYGQSIVFDLGDDSGRVVVIDKDDWRIEARSPVLFRRTELTAGAALPTRGGSLALLKGLLNVSEESWPLVVGYLISTLFPDAEHPVALLGGQQGSGKSTAARILIGLVDPSPAPLMSPPTTSDQLSICLQGTRVLGIDNISRIPEWLSDAICRATSGDGYVRRKLYTDGDLAVSSYRRAIILTSIDTGGMRGDLGDRLVMLELLPISKFRRRSQTGLTHEFEKRESKIMGALFDLLSRVISELPKVKLSEMSRMADFNRTLAAVDRVLNTGALELFRHQGQRISEEVVESDPVATAIRQLADQSDEDDVFRGTAGALLQLLSPIRPPKGWPRSARGMSSALRRCVPALQSMGVEVTPPSEANRSKDKNRDRVFRIRRVVGEAEEIVQTVRPSNVGRSELHEPEVAPEADCLKPSDDRPPQDGDPFTEQVISMFDGELMEEGDTLPDKEHPSRSDMDGDEEEDTP